LEFKAFHWYRRILRSVCPRFFPAFAPLDALKKEGVTFVWSEEHQTAFESLKQALSEVPVLQVPDFLKEFVLVMDASDYAIFAVLNQRVGLDLAPIAYCSRLLSTTERVYSSYEKECLAVLFGCENVGANWNIRNLIYIATS
jgi:hypothetical protein